VTQLLQMRAEQLKAHHNDVNNIPLCASSQERGDYVLAFQNYTGAITDLMDFEHMLSEDVTNAES